MDDKLRIGMIGLGGMGLYHAKNLHSKILNASITGIYDPDEKHINEVLAICENTKKFNDPAELIRSKETDAVIIASPDSTHAQLVQECLENRKFVFCEKPLASELGDAESIIKKETILGKKFLSVGFQRRFDPYHLAVEKVVYSGEIGNPLLWKGIHRNQTALYNNDGAFLLVNSSGHDVDSARWLLRSDVKTINVLGRKSRKELPEDAADLLLLTMEMENGSLAQSELYLNADYAYEVAVELVCQKGTASTGHTDRALLRSNSKRSFFMSGDFRGYFDEAYLAEMTDWVDSIVKNRNFSGSDAWDGYSALVVTFAGVESLRQKKTIMLKTIKKPDFYS